MKRKLVGRSFAGFLIVIRAWLILAQCSMEKRISDSKAINEFREKGITLIINTIKVDGFEMHYATTGKDKLPSLFFVHGSPGAWDDFKRYMQDRDLLVKYRMIAVDRPGFGFSQFGESKNLEEQAMLISPIAKFLRNERPMYAVGHSLGGATIVRLQVDNENLFDGLVFLAAAVDPDHEKPERWRYVMKIPPLSFLIPGAYRPSNKELVYLKTDLRHLDNNWGKITCPVWMIHGNKDKNVPVDNVDYAKRKLTNSRVAEVKILPGADHDIPWNRYEEIKEILMKLSR